MIVFFFLIEFWFLRFRGKNMWHFRKIKTEKNFCVFDHVINEFKDTRHLSHRLPFSKHIRKHQRTSQHLSNHTKTSQKLSKTPRTSQTLPEPLKAQQIFFHSRNIWKIYISYFLFFYNIFNLSLFLTIRGTQSLDLIGYIKKKIHRAPKHIIV